MGPCRCGLLRQAKREELRKEGVPVVSDSLVDSRITKAQLAQYCRRRTRGEEATIRMVERLLQELRGDRGRDLLGVPLLDRVRMEHIWRVQKRHVKCIGGLLEDLALDHEAEDEGFLDGGFREDAVDPTVTSLEVVSAFLSTAPPALSSTSGSWASVPPPPSPPPPPPAQPSTRGACPT